MHVTQPTTEIVTDVESANDIFRAHLFGQQKQADRALAILLMIQWGFAICCATWVSPFTWNGPDSSIHLHLWTAVILGGMLALFPAGMAHVLPGRRLTRMVMASSQMMFSALLIHLMGGRIEAHFHVFGSLAFLAFYKDHWVYLPAVLIVASDHLIRGIFWPQSVFGVLSPAPFRAFEHAAWVMFEIAFLGWNIGQNRASLRKLSKLQFDLTTERDQLEIRVSDRTAEIERQRQIQETILQRIPSAVFWRNPDGQILGCNKKFSEFVGEPSTANVIGRRICDFIGKQKQNSDAPTCFSQQVETDTELENIQEQIIDHRGETHTVLSGTARLQDSSGEVFAVLVAFHDISSLKAAESKATSLAKMVRESPNELYVVDAETLTISEANQGIIVNLGMKRHEIIGKQVAMIHAAKERDHFLECIDSARSEANGHCRFNSHHLRADGTTYPIHIDVHETVLEERRVLVAFCVDVSQMQEMERQLAQSQKLESMGQLAAGVAHEINTPMQCVSGNVEFLTKGYQRIFQFVDQLQDLIDTEDLSACERREQADEFAKQTRFHQLQDQTPPAIEEADQAVNRVIEIVRAMKVMSHPGKKELAETDINTLLEQASIITRNRWKYTSELELNLRSNIPMLPAYSAELSQVFINLFVNASDAIGERQLLEPSLAGSIQVTTKQVENKVEVRVSDNGCGMTPEVRRQVFDQFFTTKDVGKGTGLGLTLTYDIVVNRHDGSIDIESYPDQGTTFIVTLPLEARDEPDEFVEASVPGIMEGHRSVVPLPRTENVASR